MRWYPLIEKLYGEYKRLGLLAKEIDDLLYEMRELVRRGDKVAQYDMIMNVSEILSLTHILLSEVASILSPQAWKFFKKEIESLLSELGLISQTMSKAGAKEPVLIKTTEIGKKVSLFMWYSLNDFLHGVPFDEAILRRVALLSPKTIQRQPFAGFAR